MRKSTSAIIGLILAGNLCAQTCNMAAIEKQQRELARQVTILHSNFLALWADAYPNGAPFHTADSSAERRAAWTPQFKVEKDVIFFNDGLGCVVFMKPKSANIPSLCAPVDLQARLAMETLQEDWENSEQVPRGKIALLPAIRDSIPMLWAEEKTLYCVLQPNSMYIGLSGTSERCTPGT